MSLCWRVPEGAAGSRLDRHLAERLEQPRNQVQRWIRDGRVRLDGTPAKPSALLAGGEELDCDPPAESDAADGAVEPEAGELHVLYEDEDLVVVDKPPDLVVHPGAGRRSGTLANRLVARYPEIAPVGSPSRPGIVHRLDLGTSGVLVVARSARAYQALSRAFQERSLSKRYLAITYGAPKEDGVIDAPVGRHRAERKRMTVRSAGRPARTRYRVLRHHSSGIALLDLDLETGRTHQIRVHLKSIGHPLVGDPLYGEARWRALPGPLQRPLRQFERPALHAWTISLRHPAREEPMTFVAPPPADLLTLWRAVTGEAPPPLVGG